MQVDLHFPNGESKVLRNGGPVPRVGEKVTWPKVGDYIVESVNYELSTSCDMDALYIVTVVLRDDPRGRQYSLWMK